MDIGEACNQMYMCSLEKNFVLLPQLQLYACTPTWVYTKAIWESILYILSCRRV